MAVQNPCAGIGDWDAFRSLMPVCRRYIYFDHAAVAPLPDPTRRAVEAWLHEATEHGDVNWLQWAEQIEALRRETAEFLGALPIEIALVRNTCHGISIVAEGFPWRPGDNVVIPAHEFPAIKCLGLRWQTGVSRCVVFHRKMTGPSTSGPWKKPAIREPVFLL